jgi:YVTN family beta-propeller protein
MNTHRVSIPRSRSLKLCLRLFQTGMVAILLTSMLYVITPVQTAVSAFGFLAYVTNFSSGDISVIDVISQTVINTLPVGNDPNGIVLSPTGDIAYIANNDCNNGTVTVVDLVTESIIASIPVTRCVRGIDLTPDGLFAYVTSDVAPGVVSIINTTTHTVSGTIPVGIGPIGIAISSDGTVAYVANSADDSVSVIELSTNTVTNTVAVGDNPTGVVFTPDGAFVYVAANPINVISTTSNAVIATIHTGGDSFWVDITPDGETVYATQFSLGTVAVVKTSTNSLIGTVPVGDGPQTLSVTPDGTLVYVTNRESDTVTVISTDTNSVVDTISNVGNMPWGVITGSPPAIPGTYVLVDIKPGSDPNLILCRGNTEITVAIITTDTFDALTVDHTTVTFAGGSEIHEHPVTQMPGRHEKDVDRDGDLDLVFHIRLGDTSLTCASTEATLMGATFAGQTISGTDMLIMRDRER